MFKAIDGPTRMRELFHFGPLSLHRGTSHMGPRVAKMTSLILLLSPRGLLGVQARRSLQINLVTFARELRR